MIRHAWHFYYALVLVIKVVCGSIVLCASHLNWALGFSAGNIEFEDFGSWIMKRSYNLRTKN
ncbi:DUF3265 domain-containing protein [Vibrio parahaemolyticus]|nr:DUF3265 domain-containing protein [Vibrio parahaemolyticus]